MNRAQRRRLDALIDRYPAIMENLRWARRLGSSPMKVTDEVKISRSPKAPIDPADPTGSVALGQEKIRRSVKLGEDALLAAMHSLHLADTMFLNALQKVDNRSPLGSSQDSNRLPGKDDEQWPSNAEKRRLRQAQRRRMERDEGVG